VGQIAKRIAAFVLGGLRGERDTSWLPASYPLFERGLVDYSELHQLAAFVERTFEVRLREDDIHPDRFRSVETIEALVELRRAARPAATPPLAGVPASALHAA
jgi:hypothetical protein